jgi:hypothetical protein
VKGAQTPAGQQALAQLATLAAKRFPSPSPETITQVFAGSPASR